MLILNIAEVSNNEFSISTANPCEPTAQASDSFVYSWFCIILYGKTSVKADVLNIVLSSSYLLFKLFIHKARTVRSKKKQRS